MLYWKYPVAHTHHWELYGQGWFPHRGSHFLASSATARIFRLVERRPGGRWSDWHDDHKVGQGMRVPREYRGRQGDEQSRPERQHDSARVPRRVVGSTPLRFRRAEQVSPRRMASLARLPRRGARAGVQRYPYIATGDARARPSAALLPAAGAWCSAGGSSRSRGFSSPAPCLRRPAARSGTRERLVDSPVPACGGRYLSAMTSTAPSEPRQMPLDRLAYASPLPKRPPQFIPALQFMHPSRGRC
jgi:hypothetical protein